MSLWFILLLQFAVIAYAMVGGVFLAFSDFIMRALARTSGAGGAEAMQVINREVFRWVFMALFLGLAPVSLLIAGHGALSLPMPAAGLFALAGIIYLVGCFGVTIAFNVPMNEALAKMEATADTTRDYWTKTYLPRWSFWNSVRTGACLAASGLLLCGLAWMAQGMEG